MSVTKKNSDLVFLFGPTGVGKTALLSDLFSTGYEVINADSMQVYRGLDIGSAKPEKEILERLPHHLIDILDPWEQFTLGEFVSRATLLIEEITARGSVPVISGGTAFYFKHLLYGLPQAPPSDPAVRAGLAQEAEASGTARLYEELAAVDPVSAKRIHPSDSYRIQRALEVYRTSGNPLSSFPVTGSEEPLYDPVIIGLERERDELYARIDQRVGMMFDAGLVEEVRSLISAGAEAQWPGMNGIGYREFFIARQAGELSLTGIAGLIRQNSRRYAKRQMTFFRSLPGVHWVHPDDTGRVTELLRPRSS